MAAEWSKNPLYFDFPKELQALKDVKALALALGTQDLYAECLWRLCVDFDQLLQVNRRYLRREISTAPYHAVSLKDETAPLLGDLLALHDLRLLTFNSQPFQHDQPFWSTYLQQWAEYEQRPFVSFIVPEEEGDNPRYMRLFDLLKRANNVVVRATKLLSLESLSGSEPQVLVSRERLSKNREALSSQEWKEYTWVLCDADIRREPFFDLDVVQRCNPILFNVAALGWGDQLNLVSLIADLATQCLQTAE